MDRISAIVPVYNAEKTIEKCLNSILNQTFPLFEIVVVNDGSTDNSENLIKNLQKNTELIKYYYKENSGVADTRNYGIEKANGDYIIFIDSDDWIEPELIETIDKYIKEGVELIKYKLKKIDENGNIIDKIDGPTFEKITGEEAFNSLCFQDVLLDSPCVYIIKKSLFNKNKFIFSGKYHEDFGIIPLIVATAKTVVSIPNYLYSYVQCGNSITRNEDYDKTIEKMKCVLYQYDNMVKILDDLSLQNETKENVKTYYTNAIIQKLKELKKEERNLFIKKIKARRMYRNIKIKNFKQLIKRLILYFNINLYLKMR